MSIVLEDVLNVCLRIPVISPSHALLKARCWEPNLVLGAGYPLNGFQSLAGLQDAFPLGNPVLWFSLVLGWEVRETCYTQNVEKNSCLLQVFVYF